MSAFLQRPSTPDFQGLKARKMIAQGGALGRSPANGLSPEGAKHQRMEVMV